MATQQRDVATLLRTTPTKKPDRAGIPRPPEWTQSALCAQPPRVDPDLFFPERLKGSMGRQASKQIEAAKRICDACPVEAVCLEYALAHECISTVFGVWGGKSARQRRAIIEARRAAS